MFGFEYVIKKKFNENVTMIVEQKLSRYSWKCNLMLGQMHECRGKSSVPRVSGQEFNGNIKHFFDALLL